MHGRRTVVIGFLIVSRDIAEVTAIETKRFRPLGSDEEVSSGFAVVAATHRDLRAMVARGAFREDLLARLGTWGFKLPRLAERTEDMQKRGRQADNEVADPALVQLLQEATLSVG